MVLPRKCIAKSRPRRPFAFLDDCTVVHRNMQFIYLYIYDIIMTLRQVMAAAVLTLNLYILFGAHTRRHLSA